MGGEDAGDTCGRETHVSHLLVLDEGHVSCVSLPSVFATSSPPYKLCFDDHGQSSSDEKGNSSSVACCDEDDSRDKLERVSGGACCTEETAHVHAHVHLGDIMEDILLQKVPESTCSSIPTGTPTPSRCEECVIPRPSTVGQNQGLVSPRPSDTIRDEHEHKEGCGHEKIMHGDHVDWLVPAGDGSLLLRHPFVNDRGVSHFHDHGRLVHVGAGQGKMLRRRRQMFVDVFNYEGPRRYLSIPQSDDYCEASSLDRPSPSSSSHWIPVSPRTPPRTPMSLAAVSSLFSSAMPKLSPLKDRKKGGPDGSDAAAGGGIDVAEASPLKEADHLEVSLDAIWRQEKGATVVSTMLDVMGICCPSEVPLIRKLLEPLPGVVEVTVNVPARTATVTHDPAQVSNLQLVKVLNEARLDASLHRRGEVRHVSRWPKWHVLVCGLLLVVALFEPLLHPLRFVAVASIAVGLPPIVLRALMALRRFFLDINTLMVIAVCGAIALGDYVEGAEVVFLFSIADWLEARSSEKARIALLDVTSLAPEMATLAESGAQVPVVDVKVGTLLAVKPGELVPVDGVVDVGESAVDESSLTGESRPIQKVEGDPLWAGTINGAGYLRMRTQALAEDSAVARLVRLVEEAQNQRSHSERLVDKFARVYTPSVVLCATMLAVIPLAMGVDNPNHFFYLALVLLVVACPCALVISTPITSVCGITQAARNGIIIKGGVHLESLGKLQVLALDKTGTLTEGLFRVLSLLPLPAHAVDKTTILNLLASVESLSSHPMASALVTYARLHGGDVVPGVADYDTIPGEGVQARVGDEIVHIGNARLAERLGWVASDESVSATVEAWERGGATVGWIGTGSTGPLAVFAVADEVRKESRRAVAALQTMGVHLAILTGDNQGSALAAANKVGVTEVHAKLLPEEKVRVLQELRDRGRTARTTGMVGDGINDAPALACADVGIAMGVAGSAMAMETADVALMTNDLGRLAVAVQIGRRCRAIILENVVFSITVKVLVIGLAVAGYATLWAAVLADVGTSLIVISNSMRILTLKYSKERPKKHASSERGSCKRLAELSLNESNPVKLSCCSAESEGALCRSGGCGTIAVQPSLNENLPPGSLTTCHTIEVPATAGCSGGCCPSSARSSSGCKSGHLGSGHEAVAAEPKPCCGEAKSSGSRFPWKLHKNSHSHGIGDGHGHGYGHGMSLFSSHRKRKCQKEKGSHSHNHHSTSLFFSSHKQRNHCHLDTKDNHSHNHSHSHSTSAHQSHRQGTEESSDGHAPLVTPDTHVGSQENCCTESRCEAVGITRCQPSDLPAAAAAARCYAEAAPSLEEPEAWSSRAGEQEGACCSGGRCHGSEGVDDALHAVTPTNLPAPVGGVCGVPGVNCRGQPGEIAGPDRGCRADQTSITAAGGCCSTIPLKDDARDEAGFVLAVEALKDTKVCTSVVDSSRKANRCCADLQTEGSAGGVGGLCQAVGGSCSDAGAVPQSGSACCSVSCQKSSSCCCVDDIGHAAGVAMDSIYCTL